MIPVKAHVTSPTEVPSVTSTEHRGDGKIYSAGKDLVGDSVGDAVGGLVGSFVERALWGNKHKTQQEWGTNKSY